MFGDIKQSLHEFGVDFDVWFHEDSLFRDGSVEALLEQLKEQEPSTSPTARGGCARPITATTRTAWS